MGPADQERIEAIEKRECYATEGPWSYEQDTHATGHQPRATLYARRSMTQHGLNLLGRLEPDMNGYANLEFIAHARQDVPWLLSQLSALTEALTACQQEREPARILLSEAGVAPGTLAAGVLELLQRLQRSEAALTACRAQGEAMRVEAAAIFRAFGDVSLNGVVCSIPDTGIGTLTHRTWCARCQKLWKRLAALSSTPKEQP